MSLYNSRRLSRRLSSHSNCLSLSSHWIQPSYNDNLSHPSPFHIESHGSTQNTSTLTQHFRKSLALGPPHKLRCPRSPSLAPRLGCTSFAFQSHWLNTRTTFTIPLSIPFTTHIIPMNKEHPILNQVKWFWCRVRTKDFPNLDVMSSMNDAWVKWK